jgi:DNA-binding CsgD family transcriptional regulator/DNA-binding transcriptional regulator YiaG
MMTLVSWKDIARHLKVTVRTAQLWEAKCGLPIRRLPGSSRGGSVFAFANEIDSWKTGRPHDHPVEIIQTQKELHGWKAIADLFGVALRTVQNWEHGRGLPIHRLPGERGTVYARIDELQSWRLGRAFEPEVKLEEAQAMTSCIYCRKPLGPQELQTHSCIESLNQLQPLERSDDRVHLLQGLYDFTEVEARLADQLASGKDLRAAAEVLLISINTARSHLKWIFLKTGVRRQADLVRVILVAVTRDVPRAYATCNRAL